MNWALDGEDNINLTKQPSKPVEGSQMDQIIHSQHLAQYTQKLFSQLQHILLLRDDKMFCVAIYNPFLLDANVVSCMFQSRDCDKHFNRADS